MTNILFFTFTAAFQHVRENIEEMNGKAGVEDKDLIFLKGLMDSPILNNLVKVKHSKTLIPVPHIDSVVTRILYYRSAKNSTQTHNEASDCLQ